MIPWILFVCFTYAFPVSGRSAGILYEVWHAEASTAMHKVKAAGGTQLTTELVIRNASLNLNDVYLPYNLTGDIWNVQPAAGFYCIYRKRANDTNPPIPDCANITQTLTYHAKILTEAGFDYIAVDITNWPDMNPATDVAVFRPTEVLFEEWYKLRLAGIPTPKIALWPCSPNNSNTWQALIDTIYSNKSYEDLLYTQNGKPVMFLPDNSHCYSPTEEAKILAYANVTTIKMWALFGEQSFESGTWGFFSPCVASYNPFQFTTSMVDTPACNQSISLNPQGGDWEISASGSYMLTQTSLPFASPGHMRGLTLHRLFQKVLTIGAPNLFMSSFNEFIGGRQPAAEHSNIAFNMGLPTDPQRGAVWVDTYASDFSRDVEPTVEGGSRVFEVTSSCVQLYKQSKTCADAPTSVCCTMSDKYVYSSVWSLNRGTDNLIVSTQAEFNKYIQQDYTQICHSITGPSTFCVNTSIADGRNGPFLVYNTPGVAPFPPKSQQRNIWESQNPHVVEESDAKVVAFYRCVNGAQTAHTFSLDENCTDLSGFVGDGLLGYISTQIGGETLRALYRCQQATGVFTHALDLPCDTTATQSLIGYVR
eukprot:m.120871 g.120871  ORF g.120871 m.120871 type:complete len:592 (-) comp23253_c0_seq12:81-1856(-)